MVGPIDAEGVGRKEILPRNAIGTSYGFYAKERSGEITGIMPEAARPCNLERR